MITTYETINNTEYPVFYYKGQKNHLIIIKPVLKPDSETIFLSYENIIKNSKKLDPWKQFIIKKFSVDGEPLTDYISGNDLSIFKLPEMFEITKKYNPELLI